MLELQHRANEPGRLKNRGGQLLMEEKERKAVATKLPKIEQKLLDLAELYETEVQKPFLINGELVNDMITNAWEAHKADKHVLLKNNQLTPHVSAAIKRKLATPLFGTSKRSRSGEEKNKPPVLKINDRTLKRVSPERLKRLARKRMSRAHETTSSIASSASDYNHFEVYNPLKPMSNTPNRTPVRPNM